MKNFSSEGKPENPEKTHMIEPLTSEVKAPVVQDPTGAPEPPLWHFHLVFHTAYAAQYSF